MASVWKDNKILKKWYLRNCFDFFDGNFNYDLNNLMSDPLIDAISTDIGIDKNYIYVGAGISQFISVLLSMDDWQNIYVPSIEFGLYLRQAEKSGKKAILIPSSSIEELLSNFKKYASTEKDLFCMSSPRWFDGEMLSISQLKQILKYFKGTVVIDEAYVDYSSFEDGVLHECVNNERIILLRSFSKKYFASGLRVGYLVTRKNIDGLRNTLIPPHSTSTFSANFIIGLLNDKKILDLFANTRNYIKSNRDFIYENLKSDSRFIISNSEANFITLKFEFQNEYEIIYNSLKNLPGIQKFAFGNVKFIKIWISDSKFSNIVLSKIRESSK